jgi:hypothetical protein
MPHATPQFKTCKGRRIYTKAGAARHKMRLMQERGKASPDAHVYPCDDCKGWHWGHPGGGRKGLHTIDAVEKAVAADKAKRERAKE